jgi:transcriptional regulator with XRE-family HTH domain
MPDTKKLGMRIRDLRKQRGFNNAEELAEKADIPTSTLYRIENGDKAATVTELNSLAQALGVSLNDLLFGETVESDLPSSPPGPFDILKDTAKEVVNIEGIKLFLTDVVSGTPAAEEHYKYMKRIARGSSADIRIGRMGASMRFSFTDKEMDTLLLLIALFLANDDKLRETEHDLPF